MCVKEEVVVDLLCRCGVVFIYFSFRFILVFAFYEEEDLMTCPPQDCMPISEGSNLKGNIVIYTPSAAVFVFVTER